MAYYDKTVINLALNFAKKIIENKEKCPNLPNIGDEITHRYKDVIFYVVDTFYDYDNGFGTIHGQILNKCQACSHEAEDIIRLGTSDVLSIKRNEKFIG